MKKIVFVILLIMMGSNIFAQSYKVIVNTANLALSLSKKEVSDFLLKKTTKWADGTIVMPVDLNSNSQTREDFSKYIHGKSTGVIRSYWQQSAFSGTASAPPEKASDAEVIEFVKKNKGAIGYVSVVSNTDGVKTINLK
jgi:ABC-type phosphate transport system substrate-binding protein